MSDSIDEFAEKFLKPVADNDAKLRERTARKLPTGKEAGIEWDGQQGELRTGATDEVPEDWSGLLEMWGLNPEEIEIVGPVRRSSWDSGDRVLNSYRANIQRKFKFDRGYDFDELLNDVKTHKPSKRPAPDGDFAFVVAPADLQAGKDDPRVLVDRFMEATDANVARLKELRKAGRSIGEVALLWAGDCIEHVRGSYASQGFTVHLGLTEQIRLVRRLMTYQVKAFAPLVPKLTLVSVPGNHDIAVREGGKMATKNSDSFATDCASQVAEALSENPAAYGHVSVVVPRGEELTVSLDICGTGVGIAHGHQIPRGDAMKWWAGQAHGCQDIGDTTLLITGHLHHLKVLQEGAKTHIQLPSMDTAGSQYYTDMTGKDSPTGMLSLVVGRGGWSDLLIL
jgi:hypothetical protein